MAKTLFVVEGWGKKKNFDIWKKKGDISKDLQFIATSGHLLGIYGENDGKRESLGLDLDNYEAYYDAISNENVDQIREAIKNVDEIVVATDPDNEGHVIAYHFIDFFKKELKGKKVFRTTFPELTAREINKALKDKIPSKKYDWEGFAAQGLARAFMDRTIGWIYSPILISKLYKDYKGFSAGRVQTPALRLVYERQLKIDDHTSSVFYNTYAGFGDFYGYHVDNGKKVEIDGIKVSKNTKEDMERILENIDSEEIELPKKKGVEIEFKGTNKGKVKDFIEGHRSKNPGAPFSQDTLVGTIVGITGCSMKQAKKCTQSLYQNGFTTYPRGDTVQLGDEALESAHKLAMEEFPDDTLESPLQYEDKGDAKVEGGHTACTPSTEWFEKDFNEVKKGLKESGIGDKLTFEVYEIIWKRTVASQMKAAEYDNQKLITDIGGEEFHSKSEQCVYKGYLNIYSFEELDDGEGEETEENLDFKLEGFEKGDDIKVKSYSLESSESKAPGMYTERGLVSALKKHGIGRPSTYNSGIITDALISKDYVDGDYKEGKGYVLKSGKYQITDKGRKAIETLNELEVGIINYEYTSNMENKIDEVKEGKRTKEQLLGEFMDGIYEDAENNGIEIDDNGFVNISSFSSGGGNYEEVFSDILDPHGNQKDEFLLERNSDNGKYYKSKITGANFPGDLIILKDKCPKCGELLCEATSKAGNKYKFCSASKVSKGNEGGIKECDYFETAGGGGNSEGTGLVCSNCSKGELQTKETSKGGIVICSEDCGFFNFLGKGYEILDEECPVCGSKKVKKTTSGGSTRVDCIQKRWNSEKRQNEGCSWEGEWVND